MADPTLARLVSDLQSSGVRHADVAGNRGRSGGAGPSDHRALSFGERTVMVPVYNEVAARSDHQLETCGDGSLALVTANGERRAVSTPAEPHFYALTTAEGVPYRSLALLHGRDVLATTLLQTCIRFRNREESCQFCAVEQSLEDSRTVARKTPEQIAEVAEAAVRLDGVRQLVMTTGTPASSDRGARMMAETAAAVKARVPLPIQAQCEPPEDPVWFERMRQAGVDSLGMHLEVVEPEVRRRILPGKSELDLDTYRRAFRDAVAVFGRGQVSTYLLAGLGDSHRSIVDCAAELIDLGVYPFVVPFVPLAGTPLAAHPAPSTEVMLALYRDVADLLNAADFSSQTMHAGCAKCGACSALSLFETTESHALA